MAGFHVMKSFQGTLGYMERFLFEIFQVYFRNLTIHATC